MTAPQTGAAPIVTQTHTWIYVALSAIAGGVGAFSPKIQSFVVAHPTGAFVVGGLASIVGAFMPQPQAPK